MFRHSIHIADDEETDKQYEIPYPVLARYFRTHFESGVRNMQLVLDKGTVDRPLPGECHSLENSKASFVYWFESGSHLVATGTLRAQFDAEQKIDLLEFVTINHEEFVSRSLVIEGMRPVHQWIKEWRDLNKESMHSPEQSKKKTKLMKSPQNTPPDIELPGTYLKHKMGITEAVFQFLELAEVMGQMNPLFSFVHTNPGLKPYDALDSFVAQMTSQQQTPNGMMQIANGQRTPGYVPTAPHSQLPASPRVGMVNMGSPALAHMQAPGMQMSQSQQGTNSAGPSANTSPASSKRRRHSAVKTEDDHPSATTGAHVNGTKSKPATPRIPNKRVRAN